MLTKKVECGSTTSNNKDKNTAAKEDPNFNLDNFDELIGKYGYPYNDTCFETFTSGEYRTKSIFDHIPDGSSFEIPANDPKNSTVDVDGFVNNYKGGFSKTVPMNLTN